MNEFMFDRDTQERRISHLMEVHGDAILRTCYLLSGNLHAARRAARRVFIRAASQLSAFGHLPANKARCHLLRIAMEECPCKRILCPSKLSGALSPFLVLPPAERRAAVLCRYCELPITDAALILHVSEEALSRLLHAGSSPK